MSNAGDQATTARRRFSGREACRRYARLVAAVVPMLLLTPVVHGAPNVGLVKDLGPAGTIASGQNFNYNFAWSCPGAVSPIDDCHEMRIVEPLPLSLQATGLPTPAGALQKVCVQNPGDPEPDFDACTQPTVSNSNPTQPGATLHFVFQTNVAAGASGSFQVQTRFPGGVTSDGEEAVNSATILASCTPEALAADPSCAPVEVTVTSLPIVASAGDRVEIAKNVQGTAEPVGFNTTYRVTVRPHPNGDATGWIAPDNVVLSDVLPAGAVLVSTSPVHDSGDGSPGNPLIWNLGTVSSPQSIDITVNYPEGPNEVGDERTNTATIGYEIEGVPATPRQASASHTLAGPNPGLGGSQKTNDDHDNVVNPGQTLRYTVRARNNGNIPLGMRIDDSVPGFCEVTEFQVNNDATRLTVYDHDNVVYPAYDGMDPAGGTDYGSALFADGVSRIVVEYGDAANPIVPFSGSRDRHLWIDCDVVGSGWDGTNYVPGPVQDATTTNVAFIQGFNDTHEVDVTVSSVVTVRADDISPTIAPNVVKSAPGGQHAPGNNLTFGVRMENSGTYSSAPEQVAIVDPVFADLLAEGMTFVGSARTAAVGGNCTNEPAIHELEDYNDTGRTLIVWDWTGTGCTLARGESVSYDLEVTVGNTTLGGSRVNGVAFLGSNNPGDTRSTQFCSSSTGTSSGNFTGSVLTDGGLDGATGTANATQLCHAGNANYQVQRVTDISSRKAVRGSLDPDWLYNADEPNNVGRNVRQSSVFWQLNIDNTANVPLDRIEIIDIVPFSADDNPVGGGNTGVGTGVELGSSWRPRFVAAIDLEAGGAPAGTVVYYTQAPNPCRDNIVAVSGCNPMTTLAQGVPLTDETQAPVAGAAGQWSTVLPNDPSRVRAFRIVYPADHVVQPGETLSFTFPMYVDADAPISDCAGAATSSCSNIAWNTFGFQYREADIALANQSAPTRVGVIVQPLDAPATASLGDFVWHDTNENGLQDAGESANGINNVRVDLYLQPAIGDPVLIGTTTTINHPETGMPGYYRFDGLNPTSGGETYTVRFHRPEGLIGSPRQVGSDSTVDSNGEPSNGDFATAPIFEATGITLAAGQHDPTIDQGFYQNPAVFSLGNRVWYDVDQDGIDNDGMSGELGSSQGIPGVMVELWGANADGSPVCDAPLASQTTNATGHYLFTGLEAGHYIVSLPASNFGAGEPLRGLQVATHVVEGNDDLDAQNHGRLLDDALCDDIPAGSVVSSFVTLGPLPGDEPTDEVGIRGPEQTPGFHDITPDNRSNLTIDFGFYNESALSIVKTAYQGHDNGSRCVADGVNPLVIVDPEPGNPYPVTWCFTLTNNGATDLTNPVFTDPLLGVTPSDQGGIGGPVTGSLPLAPGASAVWYFEAVHNESVTNDVQVTMTRDGDDPVVFAEDEGAVFAYIFDPLLGVKTGEFNGQDRIRWTMVWINTSPILAENVQITDIIGEGMTYVEESLECTGLGVTTVSSCVFEAPGGDYPQGRIVVTADMGADPGVFEVADATNALEISFEVGVARSGQASSYENQGEASWTPPGADDPVEATSDAPVDEGGPTEVDVPPVAAIPSLGHAAMLLLVLLMVGFGMRRTRT